MSFDFLHIWASMSIFNRAITVSLMVMGLASIAVTIERLVWLSKMATDSRQFALRAKEPLAAWDTAALIDIARKHQTSSLAKLFRNVIQRFTYLEARPEGGITPVEAARNESERQREAIGGELRRGVSVLATVGSVAPFVGLLGTVFGIISAFHTIGSSGSAGIGSVGVGIAEALVETALGLFVAIPTVIAFNYLSSRISAVESALGRSAGQLLDEMEYQHGTVVPSESLARA